VGPANELLGLALVVAGVAEFVAMIYAVALRPMPAPFWSLLLAGTAAVFMIMLGIGIGTGSLS
jgi:hypothetical protein